MFNKKIFAILMLTTCLLLARQEAFAGDFISRPNIGQSRTIRPQTAAQRSTNPRLGGSNYTMSSEVRMQIQLVREQRRYEKQLAKYEYDLYRNAENARINRARKENEQKEKDRQKAQEKYERMMEKQREDEAKRQEEARQEESEGAEDGAGSIKWDDEEENQPSEEKKEGSWLSEEKGSQQEKPSNQRSSRQPRRGFWYAIKRALGVA